MPNCVDLDEVAHYEPLHQDLCCLQIHLFLSLVLKEVSEKKSDYIIKPFHDKELLLEHSLILFPTANLKN